MPGAQEGRWVSQGALSWTSLSPSEGVSVFSREEMWDLDLRYIPGERKGIDGANPGICVYKVHKAIHWTWHPWQT